MRRGQIAKTGGSMRRAHTEQRVTSMRRGLSPDSSDSLLERSDGAGRRPRLIVPGGVAALSAKSLTTFRRTWTPDAASRRATRPFAPATVVSRLAYGRTGETRSGAFRVV